MSSLLGEAFVRVRPDMSGFQGELERGVDSRSLEKTGGGMGSAVIGGITKVAKVASLGGVLFGGIALKSGLDRLTTIENATASLTTIMGDAGKAASLMGEIKKTVQGTPFNLDQFATAGKNLVAMNVPAAKVPGYLRAIGEAAAASGKGTAGVDAVTGAFGKMAAQGKVSLDQVWSISDAGVPALQILANGFGVTSDQMQSMISKGAVPAGKAMDVLTKGIMEGSNGAAGATIAYAGTMEKLRGTFDGSFGGLKASIARLGASALEPLMPYLTAGMTKMADFADSMAKKAGPAITAFIPKMKSAAESFKQIYNIIATGDFSGPIFGMIDDGNKFVGALFRIHDAGVGVYEIFRILATGDYRGPNSLFGLEEDSGLVTFLISIRDAVRDLFGGLKNTDATQLTASLDSAKAAIGPISDGLKAAKDNSGGFMDSIRGLGEALGGAGVGGVTVFQNLMDATAWTIKFFADHTTLATAAILAIVAGMAAAGPVNEAYKMAYIIRTPLMVANTVISWLNTQALAANTAAAGSNTGAQNTGILATIRNTATKVAHTIAETAKTAATWVGVTAIAAYEIAQNSNILATLRSTASTVAHGVAMGVIKVATLAWTGVQWLLNAALNANPISIIVLLIAGLVAAIVVAYKNSDDFRSIVQACWEGIKNAASFAWDNVLKPVFDAFMAALHWVGDAAMWLWNNAIAPAFNGIASVVSWVWDNVVSKIFEAYRFFIMDVIVPAVMWLWNNAIVPAFNGIGAIISGVWNGVIRPTFDFLKAALGFVGDTFSAIWNNVIRPIWDAFGAGIRAVYDNVVSPAFQALKDGLSGVGSWFDSVVGGIRTAWGKIIDIVKKPVEFVVNTVYLDGIKKAWDSVAGWLNLPKLPEMARFAVGGGVHGPGTGTSDSIPSLLSNNEHVWTAKETAAAGGHGAVERLRSAALKGDLARFANGGAVTWPQMFGAVKSQFPWALDNSDVRPGDPGYHGSGQALDVGAPGNDPGKLMQADKWIFDNFRNSTELIHGGGKNLKNGEDVGDGVGRYGAATMAEHYNHVHWANDRPIAENATGPGFLGKVWNGVKGAASVVTHFLRDRVGDVFEKVVAPIGRAIPSFGDGDLGKLPKAAFDKMRGGVHGFLTGKADKIDAESSASGATMGPLGGNADAYAREITRSALEHGFGKPGAMIGVAGSIVETGLKMYANNGVPESLAFPHDAVGSDHDSVGLFQQRQAGWGTLAERMNPHASADLFFNKLGTFDWRAMDPAAAAQRVQVSAFPARYSQEMGRASSLVNSFDQGGVLKDGHGGVNKSGKPEAVFTNSEWQFFRDLAAGNGNQTTALVGSMTIQSAPGATARDQMEDAMFALRRARRGGVHAGR